MCSTFERSSRVRMTNEIRACSPGHSRRRATRSRPAGSLVPRTLVLARPPAMASSATQLQLLTGDGELEEGALVSFLAHNGAEGWNRRYRVVAVMGPQSSGKSTLMNHVFGTTFREMDHERGRSQTTRGVWLARASKPDSTGATDANSKQRPTLVMDLEGTDGRERGEDDTAFEKQTALFAMATADVLMVNMWCNDLGREVASGKPLLKVVFQVNLRLFTPRKTTLLFVIRDKSRTPEDRLLETLREDLRRIWDGITKPERHESSSFEDFFRLEFVALSHFEHAREGFVRDCEKMRRRFFVDEDTDAANDVSAAVPASGLAVSLREAWRAVRENRDLDLPAHGVMVATVRCEEIARERLKKLTEDGVAARVAKIAVAADDDARACGLGDAAREAIREHLVVYDEESKFFDETIAVAKRTTLKRALEEKLVPATETRLVRVAARLAERVRDALAAFSLKKKPKKPFSSSSSSAGKHSDERRSDEHSNVESRGFAAISEAALSDAREHWRAVVTDASPYPEVSNEVSNEVEVSKPSSDVTERSKSSESSSDSEDVFVRVVARASAAFEKEMERVIDSARADLVAETTRDLERSMERSVGSAIASALDDTAADLWDGVNAVVASRHARHVGALAAALAETGLGKGELDRLTLSASSKTRDAAEAKIHELTSVRNVVSLMKRAFSRSFSKDSRGLPRAWRASDDVARANALAQKEAARALALVAVSRLRDPREAFEKDAAEREARSHAAIEQALFDALVPSVDPQEPQEPREPNGGSRPEDETARVRKDGDSFSKTPPTTRKKSLPVEWAEEDSARVLLDPGACRDAWRAFESDIAYVVSQAMAAQAAAARGGAPNAPAWMYAALLVAGADEAFWLLRNPFTLLFFAAAFLFLRAVYRRLDVETAMRMGLVPGIMFLATRVVPAVMQVLSRLMEEGRDAHGLTVDKKEKEKEAPSRDGEAFDSARAPAISADGMKRRGGGAMMVPTD